MAKFENKGTAKPQAHDAMTIDALKPMKETVTPDSYKRTEHGDRTTDTRSWNIQDASQQ